MFVFGPTRWCPGLTPDSSKHCQEWWGNHLGCQGLDLVQMYLKQVPCPLSLVPQGWIFPVSFVVVALPRCLHTLGCSACTLTLFTHLSCVCVAVHMLGRCIDHILGMEGNPPQYAIHPGVSAWLLLTNQPLVYYEDLRRPLLILPCGAGIPRTTSSAQGLPGKPGGPYGLELETVAACEVSALPPVLSPARFCCCCVGHRSVTGIALGLPEVQGIVFTASSLQGTCSTQTKLSPEPSVD